MKPRWLNTPNAVSAPLVVAASTAGIGLIGVVDYYSGVEYRLLPLYYLPLALVAWHLGRAWGLAAAVLCALAWMGSNYWAGLRYSGEWVWIVNFTMQTVSFAVVAVLIAAVRDALLQAESVGRTDDLTLLINARAFSEEGGRILALGRRHHHPVTLAYIDLDNFKAVNDTLGHHRGDEILRATADLIRRTIRTGDIPARVGGDEFVVLLPETGPDGALTLLERLRLSLTEALGPGSGRVTASIGAVSFLEPPLDIGELIRQADALMYSAKAGGKDRVVVSVARAHEVKG